MVKNYLTEKNAGMPSYSLDKREMYFTVYMRYDGELCILHCYDNNYVGGVYFSTVDNREELSEIFSFCLENRPVLAQYFYKVVNGEYDEITKGFSVDVKKEYSAQDAGMHYKVSGSRCYIGDDITRQGNSIAREIKNVYDEAQKKIEVHMMNDHYYATLEKYYDILTQSDMGYKHYYTCQPIGQVLEEQGYMRLCKEEKVRNLFVSAQEAMGKLYNEYMNAVH